RAEPVVFEWAEEDLVLWREQRPRFRGAAGREQELHCEVQLLGARRRRIGVLEHLQRLVRQAQLVCHLSPVRKAAARGESLQVAFPVEDLALDRQRLRVEPAQTLGKLCRGFACTGSTATLDLLK